MNENSVRGSGMRTRIALWFLFISICAASLYFNLRFSYDLGVFLPAPQTDEQKVLIERLGEGPGSRFLLLGLHNANENHVELAIEALQSSSVFSRVLSSTSAPELSDIPDIIWRYRYLLSDTPLNAATINTALKQRATDLALFSGDEFNTLLRADPGFSAIDVMQGLAATLPSEEDWVTDDGTTLLIVETRTPAFDLAGQKSAVSAIRKILSESVGFDAEKIEISGVGAFGVELQHTIQSEATKRSIFASIGLALVLFFAYRRLTPLILAAIPLLTGLLGGLSIVALVFPQVHGITLAFGFTLLGIAIDYPLHLFSHARRQNAKSAIDSIWPTLRLGAASTLIAYIGISLSGAEGLAQLGMFTSVGVLTAALTTRWVLPYFTWTHSDTDTIDANMIAANSQNDTSTVLHWSPATVLFLIGGGLIFASWPNTDNPSIWNNSLSSLSPVPEQRLSRDHELRQLAGTPNLRYVIALRHGDLQRVLESTESLDNKLQTTANEGLIDNWQTVTRLLPSEKSQLQRQANLPETTALQNMLVDAVTDTPFALQAFTPFIQDVDASRSLASLTKEDFQKSSVQAFIDNQLYHTEDKWVSIISLHNPQDINALENWLSENSVNAVLVDFKTASETLVADYRQHTLKVLAIALIVILGLLLWRLPYSRALWSLTNVLSVVVTTTAVVYLLAGALNLYHMMALLLVAGLGLDYVLFTSRNEESGQNRADTRHAIIACAASTTVAFGILGMSAIPALQSMGQTVATGTAMSFLLAWFGVKRKPSVSSKS